MAGHWRTRLNALADIAGVDGPPARGGLCSYAEDLIAGTLSAARATRAEVRGEHLAAIAEMEEIAVRIIEFDGDERTRRSARRATRISRTPAPTTTADAAARRASVRDHYRRKTP